MFSSSSWDDIKQSSTSILNEIVFAIIQCKKSNIDSYPVSFDLYKAYVELNKKFYAKVYYICDTCEETSIPSCPVCGGTHFAITKKAPAKIVCNDCGRSQSGPFVFVCENGHEKSIATINNAISLIATDDFTEELASTIKLYYPDVILDHNEYFELNNGSLILQRSPDYEKLKASDIQEFSPIINRQLTHPIDFLSSVLRALKEKCSSSTNVECCRCKYKKICNSNDIQCILKLFENFEGYTPQPHHGHEFGDVSMLLTYNGKNLTFLGAAKSVDCAHPKITKSHKLGREILQQIIDAFNDNRTEIIGVIYPDLIDDQLKYLLFHEAKIHNKKFLILDKEFMLHLLDQYLTDKKL